MTELVQINKTRNDKKKRNMQVLKNDVNSNRLVLAGKI